MKKVLSWALVGFAAVVFMVAEFLFIIWLNAMDYLVWNPPMR